MKREKKNLIKRIMALIVVMGIMGGLFYRFPESEVIAADYTISNSIWDGTVATAFAAGSGTTDDPYIISTAAELAYLAESVNNGISYRGKHIALKNDIYLNDTSNFDNWSNTVIPNNVWKGMNDFCGTIDGCENTIYGMYVCNSQSNSGFINSTKSMSNSSVNLKDKATIKNINFKKSYVYGTTYVGTIIGEAKYAEIDNCKVEGVVIAAKSNAGGFVGHFSSGGNRGLSIINSTNHSIVSGNTYVGGFVGSASVGNSSGYDTSGNGSEKIVIKNCMNYGTIDAGGNYVGGIAGRISRSMNCGGLELRYIGNLGNISGAQYVGGLFGRLTGDYYAISMDESFNSGNVTGTSYVGGLIGMADSGTSASRAVMQNLYNVGNVGLEGTTSYVGGIFGAGSYVSILYCYNGGIVAGKNNAASLIGYASDVSDPYGLYGSMVIVKYSYYLSVTSLAATAGTKTNVGSFTASEINNCDTFKGFDFESIWRIGKSYIELQWQQQENSGYIENNDIISRVAEYTSDELYAQYDKITNSNYSYDVKNKMYQSLFQSYGITDVREGIRYLSNTTNKRYAYLALTTDDLYCASNFKYWLKNTAKGIAAQVVLLADGLIYNNEINDWLDFTTYRETDFPGVAKYKAMLYDFMGVSSDSIEIMSNIKLVSDMSGKATGAAKLKADSLIKQLNSCSTAAEAQKIMNSSAAMEVWIELAEVKDKSGNFVRDNNGSIELTYKLDESSGFGQFSKAMGQATKGVSIANMAISDVMDLLKLDSKLAVYAQYRRFLQDIVLDTDGLPFQMRWAAVLILIELEEGYISKIKDIAWDIIHQTNLNSVVLKQIIGEKAAGSLSSWLAAIGIEAFFINKIADIGEMVKKESAVEGYASLSSSFTRKLERSKQAFLEDKTESNAWDFYYNYNILYRLRYKGEEAYLSMTKIKGFLSCFSDFGYAEKEAVVNDTLQMLKSRCRFTLDAAQPIPESCQFASKSVVNCPVNVSVYAEGGTLIAELLDGVESDVTNAYGRFVVVLDSYSGDYTKVICLNSEENASFKITGTDSGLVTMDFAQAKGEESNVYAFDSVPIDKDAVINTTIQEITEQNTYGIDADADGNVEEYGTITVKPEAYVPIASVELSETALELKAGESSVLKVTVTPTNATNQKVLWMSADPSVAVVADGKVTAVAEGVTTIYCMILDDMDKMISCEVTVSSDMECIHQNTEVRNQLTVTCGAEGYTGDTYCTDCNTKLETGQVIALTEEHTWDDGEEIKSPTCTEKGEKEYTCTVCGEIKTEEIEAKGHQNTEMRNQLTATCGAEGYTGDTYCRDCSTKLETGQVIVATGKHTWDGGKAIKSPTCTEKGEKEYTCTVCGETKTEEIEAKGHQDTEVRNQHVATCGVEGYTGDTYCKDCNTKFETGQVIASTGEHTWNDGEEIKSAICTEKGEKEYTCIVCGETKKEEIEKLAHTYKTTVTKATTANNGNVIEKCATCDDIKSNKAIPSVKSVDLKSSSYTYNGREKKPSVVVRDSNGKVVGNHNYTVAYKNNKKIGKAIVTIKLKGNYTGKITKTFKILPKGTSISGKIVAISKGFRVKWKKQKKNITGYQIQYSTNRKFKNKATVKKMLKKKSVTKLSVRKLKPKKKYYVRIRTYKIAKGKKYYSAWSKAKTVTTKK